MATKSEPIIATGAEFKAWLSDDWGSPEAYWDDFHVTIDGTIQVDYDETKIADDATVRIESGVVYIPKPKTGRQRTDRFEEVDALTHFKRWRRAQATFSRVVDVPKDQMPAFEEFVTSIGGTIHEHKA